MPSINPSLLLKKFIDKYANPQVPVLVGLSGGSDSLMLFYLLLDLQVKMAVAHVDHGWRAESSQEAIELESLAAKHQIPFHLRTLDPARSKGNLENWCRQERMLFFKRIAQEYGYQAVLLGHHADDQAETVLKRLFEGAHLTSLSGLSDRACLDGLCIWRPFLQLSKNDILDWLAQRDLKAFEDKTNTDPKFLRARMRTSLIPNLSLEFGKEITAPLVKLGQEAQELKEFLDSHLNPYLQKVEKDFLGISLNISLDYPHTLFEMKHLVKMFCQLEHVTLSRQQLATAAELLLKNTADKRLLSQGWELCIHLRRMTLRKRIPRL